MTIKEGEVYERNTALYGDQYTIIMILDTNGLVTATWTHAETYTALKLSHRFMNERYHLLTDIFVDV